MYGASSPEEIYELLQEQEHSVASRG